VGRINKLPKFFGSTTKVLEELYTFTWKNKIASFSPMIKGYPNVTHP
jgi:hypothetical protein